MRTKLEVNIDKGTDGLYKSYFIGIGEPFFNFFALGKTKKEAFELLMYGMKKNVYTICKIFYTEDISITEEEMYGI